MTLSTKQVLQWFGLFLVAMLFLYVITIGSMAYFSAKENEEYVMMPANARLAYAYIVDHFEYEDQYWLEVYVEQLDRSRRMTIPKEIWDMYDTGSRVMVYYVRYQNGNIKMVLRDEIEMGY